MSGRLHMVCLDAPSPPDYGGAIDMYYKIAALAKAGHSIILHYFDYKANRGTEGLEKYCTEIHRYSRKTLMKALPVVTPYFIGSRVSQMLVERLNARDEPILLEGLHGAGLLRYLDRPERVVIRMHNEEATYYTRIAATEKNSLKRIYLKREGDLTKRFYRHLSKDQPMACLSESDLALLRDAYGFRNLEFIPCFIPWQKITGSDGRGSYCLYHGNLRVSENEAAALWLIREVFSKLSLPLIVAGQGAGRELELEVARHAHIRLIKDPGLAEVDELVRNAQVNVLPSLNQTGVKLKLLHAVFSGRHCLTNGEGLKGSAGQSGVALASTAAEFGEAVQGLFGKPFTEADREARKGWEDIYQNGENARKLSALWRRYQ